VGSNRNPQSGGGFRAGRPAGPHVSPDAASAPAMPDEPKRGVVDSWVRFWFTPADPIGLHWLRVFSGLVFLFWLLPFAGQVDAFYGAEGWIDREAYREMSRADQRLQAILSGAEQGIPPQPVPPRSWSLLYLVWNDSGMLHAFYWVSIAVLFVFTLGLWTRITSVLTWLIVASFLANPVLRFEAEFLLVIVAMYLMLGYGLQGLWSRRLSTAERILGPRDNFLFMPWLRRGAEAQAAEARSARDDEPRESYAANLAVRLLQIHFALVVVVSGLHKLQAGAWWGGWAIFYPLHNPFDYTFETFRAKPITLTTNLFLLSVIQYAWMVWQLAFPAFAWRTGLWARLLLIGGGVLGWIGCVWIYKMPLFGPIYLLGCLSYLTVAEWRWILGTIQEIAGDWTRRAAPAKRVKVGSSN
jgi:hypothetical protein